MDSSLTCASQNLQNKDNIEPLLTVIRLGLKRPLNNLIEKVPIPSKRTSALN